VLPRLIGQAIARRVGRNGCTRVQARALLARVAEASPGTGRTEHLAITPIEVSLGIVPCSHDEIAAGKGRP